MNKEDKRNYWKQIIDECNQSGMRKVDWLNEHNISEKAFYAWQLRFKKENQLPSKDVVCKQFIELKKPLSKPNAISATIHKSDISIDLSDTISDDLLLKIMKAVSHA